MRHCNPPLDLCKNIKEEIILRNIISTYKTFSNLPHLIIYTKVLILKVKKKDSMKKFCMNIF